MLAHYPSNLLRQVAAAIAFFASISAVPAQVFLGTNFDGATSDGWTPPDPNAAAGPNYIVETSNQQLTILTKDGTIVSNVDLGTFFGHPEYGDAHVIYNEMTQRFAVESPHPDGTINFAVSTSSDPTGSWMTQNFPVPGGLWDGYGGNAIGYNAEAYVVRFNGLGNTFVVFNVNDSSLSYRLVTSPYRLGQPVPMPGAAPGDPIYFVNGNDDGLNDQGGTPGWLEVVKVENVLSPTPVFTDYQIQVNDLWTSVMTTSWRNGQLAITGKVIPSGGSVHQIAWYLLDTTGDAPVLVQSGAITADNGGDGDYPSIAIAPNGNIGLNYLDVITTSSNATVIYATGRTPTDAPGTMQTPVQVQSGANSNGRLGDYSSSVVDIDSSGNAQNSFWGCNEYLNTADQYDWRERLLNFSPLPSSVAGLVALGGDTQVNLSWTASLGATSYNVKRATAAAGPYTAIGNPTGASYTDTAVTNGTIYYYVVSAISSSEGADSAPVNATPGGTPPPAPLSLAATAGSNQVNLSWNASSGATSYNVKRATADGGPFYEVVATVMTTNYTDSQAANFVTYFYVVSAVNSAGESADSAQVSATPFGSPPAPGGLSASNSPPVLVSWLGVFGATGYDVKRATTSGGPYTTIVSLSATPDLSMSFSDATATAGGTYYYVVSALNAGGESANSSEASATVPMVLMVGSSGGGQFTLSFDAVSGQNYVIETSTNLADWVPVLTNTATSGVFNFIDTNTTAPMLFYRARQ